MRVNFEELDYQKTALGELVLQRRNAVEADGRPIVEVKLNGEYLMSSLFVAGEVALADLGLSGLSGEGWEVAVGGLGLGYTAAAALKYAQIARLSRFSCSSRENKVVAQAAPNPPAPRPRGRRRGAGRSGRGRR